MSVTAPLQRGRAGVRLPAGVAGGGRDLPAIPRQGGADAGPPADLVAGLQISHRPVDAPSVGDRQSWHLEVGRPHRQLGRV